MFVVANANGEYWTGYYRGQPGNVRLYEAAELAELKLDGNCHPANFFNHSPADAGWGLEDGTIFARAREVQP